MGNIWNILERGLLPQNGTESGQAVASPLKEFCRLEPLAHITAPRDFLGDVFEGLSLPGDPHYSHSPQNFIGPPLPVQHA